MYSYTEDSSQTQQTGFGFGLNQKCYLKEFKLVKDQNNYVQITIEKDGNTRNQRYYEITRAYGSNGEIITDKNSKEFQQAQSQLAATLIHIVKAYIDEEIIKEATKEGKTFKDFTETLTSLLPENYSEIPVDVFLEFQSKIKKGQKRTYLEIPRFVSYGKFFVKNNGKEYKKDIVEDAGEWDTYLRYINVEGDEMLIHPFKRSKHYMSSSRAKQQIIDDTPKTESSPAQDSDELPF